MIKLPGFKKNCFYYILDNNNTELEILFPNINESKNCKILLCQYAILFSQPLINVDIFLPL